MAVAQRNRMPIITRIYDSRKGDDWVETTQRGKQFSLRENSFWLARCTPAGGMSTFDPCLLDQFIKTCMQCTGNIGFFSISSVDNGLRSALMEPMEMIELQGSLMGYFSITDSLVFQYLALKRLVSFQAVVIGSVRERLDTFSSNWKTYAWDIDYLFDQINKVGCFCRFDGETATLEIFTRIYAGLDAAIGDWKRRDEQ